jgi:hypothetical protein
MVPGCQVWRIHSLGRVLGALLHPHQPRRLRVRLLRRMVPGAGHVQARAQPRSSTTGCTAKDFAYRDFAPHVPGRTLEPRRVGAAVQGCRGQVRDPDLQAPRRVRPLAFVEPVFQRLERGGSRPEARSGGRPHQGRPRPGAQNGVVLLAHRVGEHADPAGRATTTGITCPPRW